MSSLLRKAVVSGFYLSPQCRGIGTTKPMQEVFNIVDCSDFVHKVKKNKKPVVVSFYATWNRSSRELSKMLDSEFADKGEEVDLANVDIDEMSELVSEYDVECLPILVAFKNGEEVDRLVGPKMSQKLGDWLDKTWQINGMKKLAK